MSEMTKMGVQATYSKAVAEKNQKPENPWMAVYRADDVEESSRVLHEFIADRYDEHRKTRNLSKFTLQIKQKIEELFKEVKP